MASPRPCGAEAPAVGRQGSWREVVRTGRCWVPNPGWKWGLLLNIIVLGHTFPTKTGMKVMLLEGTWITHVKGSPSEVKLLWQMMFDSESFLEETSSAKGAISPPPPFVGEGPSIPSPDATASYGAEMKPGQPVTARWPHALGRSVALSLWKLQDQRKVQEPCEGAAGCWPLRVLFALFWLLFVFSPNGMGWNFEEVEVVTDFWPNRDSKGVCCSWWGLVSLPQAGQADTKRKKKKKK